MSNLQFLLLFLGVPVLSSLCVLAGHIALEQYNCNDTQAEYKEHQIPKRPHRKAFAKSPAKRKPVAATDEKAYRAEQDELNQRPIAVDREGF